MRFQLHFDDIVYQLQKNGGISVYWKEITSRISMSHEFSICRTKGSKVTRYLPVLCDANIFHSSYFRLTPKSKTKNVVTIHDFIYELGWLKTRGSAINILQRRLAIEAADTIICVSENTKNDLLKLYPNLLKYQEIYTVYNGSSFSIENPSTKESSVRLIELNRQKSLDKYVLFIGGRVSYKNFDFALLSFAASVLPKLGYTMICTGAKLSEVENELLTKLNLQSKVLAIDNATYEELNYLYQNAFALIYPSFYEGFGLPTLEAMNCGCPVIASNTSSLPEIIGDAGILIDPQDISSISAALEKLLDDEVRNNYLTKGIARAKLFSWDNAAKKHIQLYKSLIT